MIETFGQPLFDLHPSGGRSVRNDYLSSPAALEKGSRNDAWKLVRLSRQGETRGLESVPLQKS